MKPLNVPEKHDWRILPLPRGLPPRWKTWISGAALLLILFMALWPTLHAASIWDDDACIFDNQLLHLPRGLWLIWTRPNVLPEGHYWPLLYTSFWVEQWLFGGTPFFTHLDNMLLQAANALLLWWLLRRLRVPGAWLGAALFAIHPLNVESVAWAVERKNVLSGLFYLLSIHAYLSTMRSRQWRDEGLALLCFLLALIVKSSTVVLPLALVILVWWKRGRLSRRDLLSLLPFFAVAAGYTLMDVIPIKGFDFIGYTLTPWQRIAIAGRSFWFYVMKTLWPYPLVGLYPRWEPNAWALAPWLAALLGLLALLGCLRRRLSRGPLAAMLYYLVALSPALGFFDFGFLNMTFVADRFQYLAGMGLFALLGAMAGRAMAACVTRRARAWATLAATLLLALLGVLSFRQARLFHQGSQYWAYNVSHYPNDPMALVNLADEQGVDENLDEAKRNFLKVLAQKPMLIRALICLSHMLLDQGKVDEALPYIERSLFTRDPSNQSKAQFHMGWALEMKGKPAEAMAYLNHALSARPNSHNEGVYNIMGMCMTDLGHSREALQCFKKALSLSPEHMGANNNLGLFLMASGRVPEAIHYFTFALQKAPKNSKIHFNLGCAWMNEGQTRKAAQEFATALRLEPGFTAAARQWEQCKRNLK